MPSYKLTYFNARGHAEPIRVLFALAGQIFEDVRISGDEWKDLKPKTPLGQVPVLEVDGKQLPQSKAIVAYVAQEFGLYGSTSLESAQMDAVMNTLSDVMAGMSAIYKAEPDETKRAAALEKFKTEEAPKKMKGVDDLFTTYGNGYLVGNKISVADVVLYCAVEALGKEVVAEYPKLSALIDKIASNEKLAAHLKSRPVTAM